MGVVLELSRVCMGWGSADTGGPIMALNCEEVFNDEVTSEWCLLAKNDGRVFHLEDAA